MNKIYTEMDTPCSMHSWKRVHFIHNS